MFCKCRSTQIQLAYNIAGFLTLLLEVLLRHNNSGTIKIETNVALSYQPLFSIVQRQQLQHFDG